MNGLKKKSGNNSDLYKISGNPGTFRNYSSLIVDFEDVYAGSNDFLKKVSIIRVRLLQAKHNYKVSISTFILMLWQKLTITYFQQKAYFGSYQTSMMEPFSEKG